MADASGVRVTVSYRGATAADIPAIDHIFRTSFCDTFAHLYAPADLSAFLGKFTPDAWRAELDDPGYAFRVAQADGESVGYVKLGPLTLPVEPEAPAMELRQLYLLKGHHGTGIATELMDWALAESGRRGAGELYLTVYVDNHRARRFYERYGFVAVGRYDFMVGSQADEDIIMKKRL
jgi:ribosomal protein S18 acetylase RimI-like enzyme